MKNKSYFASIDWLTILIYIVLLAIGWMSICGACYDYGEPMELLSLSSRTGMQLLWIGTSVALAAVILSLDDRLFDTFAYLFYGAMMLLLAVTPLLAHDIKGSMSWIKIGSFSLQPAEFAKFATSLALAKFMSSYGFRLQGSWQNLFICIALLAVPMGLIVLQRETGSALVYLSLFLMLYREGMPGYFIFAAIAAVADVVVGLRFAGVMWLNGTVSAGLLLVVVQTLVLTAVLIHVYCRPLAMADSTTGDVRHARQAHRTAMLATLVYALGAIAAIVAAAHFALPSPHPDDEGIPTVSVAPWMTTALKGAVVATPLLLAARLLWLAFTSHIRHYAFIALFTAGSVGLFFSADYLVAHLQPHQRDRVQVLLGLKDDPSGVGYNVIQAQIAIGSGGLEGKGFLNGTQTKLKYVPEQETDFIFCTVGEEQGFIGSAAVLLLFLFLLLRLLHLAERQPYAFGRVYGYCVFSIFFFHVLINIGMVLGLMPVIGIPLPLFSYGGSSLWGFTFLLFTFLRIDAGRSRSPHQA